MYPGVILQEALRHNAGAVIYYHDRPSGTVEPSAGDARLIGRAKDLLEEIDVHLLDHIVVSRTETVTMATPGLI